MGSRIRTLSRYLAAATVSGVMFLPVPTAGADVLPNGLDVTCQVIKDTTASCLIAGCPRVHGDYVVDAVHIIAYSYQVEKEFKCINGGRATYTTTFKDFGPHTIHLQACRKKDLEGDWCGPWSDYTFNAPAPAPAAPAPAPAPAPEPKPIKCTAGRVLVGDQCVAAPQPPEAQPPHDAVTMNVSTGGLAGVTVNVTNSADIAGTCTYDAVADNKLIPPTHRQLNLPAKGNASLHIDGVPTFSTYQVTLASHGIFNGKDVEFGHVQQSVSY